MESKEDSKESNVSFKRKTHCPLFRVCPIKSLFSAISSASAERDDSQGCTAHVKETPPSPKEKPEDLIGADIDSVRDDEDWFESLYSLMAKGSMESIDSGVSLKSDQSKRRRIDFKDRVSLREDSKESDVSFKTDGSQCYKIWSSLRVRPKKSMFAGMGKRGRRKKKSQGRTAHVKETPPSPKEKPEDLIGADINSVRDDEDWVKSLYSLMAKGSMESIDSGVSLKSDRSNHRQIHFKDSSSLR